VGSETYNATYLFYWKPGETHTIAVATPQAGASGTQYVWNNWSDSGAISHTVTTPSTATTYTAGFTTQYYLTTAVGIGGSAAGSISPASRYVNAGASESITATATAGYAFTGFSGDLSGSTNPGSITMNAPHSVTANFGLLTAVAVASASGQYSDRVTPSATITPPGLAVSGALQFAVNGVNVGGPVTVNGAGTYSAPTSYVITQGQGTYTGAITAVFTSTTVGVLGGSGAGNLVVSRENAQVTPAAGNPISVQVSAPGGTASTMTLVATIQEPADANPGDIAKATPVTLSLIPVVAAPSITCPASTSVSAQILTAAFTCTNVPVNVYDVAISIGGNYYTGAADSVLVVYDPSLGFVTGGGTILHNGVPANLGINVKYLKNGQLQGGMLYIEHRPAGDVILKSNALTGLSIVGNTAVLLSKATLNGAGNYSIQATAIDNGEPGTSDQFGLQVTGPSGTVPDLTFVPATLTKGNLQVPQKK